MNDAGLRYAFYLGCTVSTFEVYLEKQARLILPKLGVELVDMPKQACCGTPFRSINNLTWLTMTAYNLALAEKMNLPILTLCNGCNLTFDEVNHYFEQSPEKLVEVNAILKDQGLKYSGKTRVVPILSVLYDDVGIGKLKSVAKKPLKKFKIAAHSGCHVIRPSRLTNYDDPEAPIKLEALLSALGAKTERYQEELDCCGLPILGMHPELAMQLSHAKIKAIKDQGYDAISTICASCQMVYGTKQPIILREMQDPDSEITVKNILAYVGLAMGYSPDELGENLNRTPQLVM